MRGHIFLKLLLLFHRRGEQGSGSRREKTEKLEQGCLLRHGASRDRSHGAPHPFRGDMPAGQGSLPDFLVRRAFGNDGNGLFRRHGCLDRLDIVQFRDVGHTHSVLAENFIKVLARRNIRRQAHIAFALKLAQIDRAPAVKGMSRRCDKDQALLPAGDGAETWAGFGIGDQSQISAAFGHCIVNFLSLAVVDRDIDTRMGFAELLEHRGKIVQGDTNHACEAKFAIKGAAGNPEAGSEAVKAGENIPACLEIDDSFWSQREGIAPPVDEWNSELFFHDAYLLADRALGDTAGFRRAGKAASVAQIAEDLESLNVHSAEFAR